jgi:hypothetical protein
MTLEERKMIADKIKTEIIKLNNKIKDIVDLAGTVARDNT